MVMRGLSPGWTPSTLLPVYSPCPLGLSRSQRLRCKGQSTPLQSTPLQSIPQFATENSLGGKNPTNSELAAEFP